MRALLAITGIVLFAASAHAAGPTITGGSGIIDTGPRILGEPEFAFEMDALEQAETSRAGWSVDTTRASTCMSYSGTEWTTQPADTACVGRWGLECFGGFTQEWVNSDDASLWTQTGAPAVTEQPDGSYLVEDDNAAGFESLRGPTCGSGVTCTVTCEVKAAASSVVSLGVNGNEFCSGLPVTAEFTRVSCTLLSEEVSASFVLPGVVNTASVGSVYVRQCQLTKTPHPTPRHDCGAAACTRAGDVHTVSTAGWPVESGEVRLQYTPIVSGVPTANRFLVDARSTNTTGVVVYVNTSGELALRVGDGAAVDLETAVLTWTAGVTYDIVATWGAGAASIERVGSPPGTLSPGVPTPVLPATATIGGYFGGGTEKAQGSIRLLRVSE